MAFIRTFTKRIFIVSNIVVVVLFLLTCSNAWLSAGRFWIISLLSLIFPLLLLLVIGFLIFWLFFHSRRLCFISAIALLIGWPNIHAFIAFDIHKPFKLEKPAKAFRILTWNVHGWDEFVTKKPGLSGHRLKMMEFINQQNADIVCFQEFIEPNKLKDLSPNIEYIRNELRFPYYYYSSDFIRRDQSYTSGIIIFSKYPITDTFKIKFNTPTGGNPRYVESILAADININGKIVRVFTTHLQSVLFKSKDWRDVEIIKNVDDQVLEASKSIVKKLKTAYTSRRDQADSVRAALDKSPYPEIICGDFNDVPNSYVYFHILGDRRDAFIKKGFGLGRTYVNISPTLRIDYIMADRQLNVLQCAKFPIPYSDHHPVIADLQMP